MIGVGGIIQCMKNCSMLKHLIIETLKIQLIINSKGWTPKDKMIEILDATFDFGTHNRMSYRIDAGRGRYN